MTNFVTTQDQEAIEGLTRKIKHAWLSLQDGGWNYCDEHSVEGEIDFFAGLAARVALAKEE